MKLLSFYVLAIFVFSNTAHADLLKKHQEICESPEAKELMGEKGACKVLVVPQPVKTISGMCVGNFKSLTCALNFASATEGTSLNLKCGELSQDIDAKAGAYKVAGLVKMENGKNNFLTDSREYVSISSKIISLKFTQIEGSIKEPSIEINLGIGSIPLTNILCI